MERNGVGAVDEAGDGLVGYQKKKPDKNKTKPRGFLLTMYGFFLSTSGFFLGGGVVHEAVLLM